MLRITQLFIYPIKSLGGIEVKSARVTDRGLEHDRRWMLIDDNDRFLSQRESAQLALLKTAITREGLQVTYTVDNSSVLIPFTPGNGTRLEVKIWEDTCTAQLVKPDIDAWFTAKTGISCRLVYMPDDSLRPTDSRYTPAGVVTSFSDAYPILMIGQAALDDLNKRLPEPLPMHRFRPNIVFNGGYPFSEDQMKRVVVNGIDLYGVKLCARCIMTTIDQETARKGKEPLKTLSRYRMRNNKIYFGQNMVANGTGIVHAGDEMQVLETHHEERFLINPVDTL